MQVRLKRLRERQGYRILRRVLVVQSRLKLSNENVIQVFIFLWNVDAVDSLHLRIDNCHATNKLRTLLNLRLLPPQGFGPEAKTRGGTLGFPACIHMRNFKM